MSGYSRILPLLLLLGCTDKTEDETTDTGKTSATPTAQITAPSLGEQIKNGALYIARGVVSDPDDNMEALIVHWFLGDEEKPRECPQGVRPDEDGITQCDVSFSRDKPLIRLRVQDDEGNIYEDGVSVEVVDASAPTVTITSPETGSEFRETDLINFEGIVSDGEDFPEALSLRWESSLSGILDIGSTVDADGNVQGAGALPSGTHTIRLWAEDTSGRETNAETMIFVFPPEAAPVLEISQPEGGSSFEAGDLILFVASVSDERDIPDSLSVSWTSSADGPLGEITATADGRVEFYTSSLSVGPHAITATVVDSDGRSASTSVVIEVTEPATPDTGSAD